ncbi:TetR-like C-terminal domain-containing protein [Micromonospora haikouensis]|uniref:TetR-like C-terminal domain-containing protein n=1 Tax=Micromonospora haikouensis TaxID=686309 RepID=UPI001C4083C5
MDVGTSASTWAPAAALRRTLAFWTRLHGVLSLELAGQFVGAWASTRRSCSPTTSTN